MALLPSGLPDAVADEEDLARFLTSSSQFNTTMVKPSAFLPPGDGKTSISRHGAEPRTALWLLAEHAVGIRTLHGAAIVKARHVRTVPLEVEPDEPPPRHANIVGWHSSEIDPDLARAERKEQALRIAQHAQLLRP